MEGKAWHGWARRGTAGLGGARLGEARQVRCNPELKG